MKWMLGLCLLMTASVAACSSGSGGGALMLDGGSTGGTSSGGTSSGGTSGGTGGTSSGTGGTSSGTGAVALTVSSTSTPYQIDNSSPSGGNAFEELDITLQNKSSATPISMNFALFTLGTDQSLVVNTSALSSAVVPECSPTTSVANGGEFSCKLVFEVPTGQKATTLYYDDKQGHQASAQVPAPPPANPTCEQFVGILDKTGQNNACSQCVLDATSGSGACASQFSAKNGACANPCLTTCAGDAGTVDPATECTCYQNCANAACWSASLDLMKCLVNQCSSSC